LISTIQLPRDLSNIGKRLPQANYDRRYDRRSQSLEREIMPLSPKMRNKSVL